jgi:hypothetical protein
VPSSTRRGTSPEDVEQLFVPLCSYTAFSSGQSFLARITRPWRLGVGGRSCEERCRRSRQSQASTHRPRRPAAASNVALRKRRLPTRPGGE